MAKPIKMLELYYQMIQFLIISNSNWKNEKITKENKKRKQKSRTADLRLYSTKFQFLAISLLLTNFIFDTCSFLKCFPLLLIHSPHFFLSPVSQIIFLICYLFIGNIQYGDLRKQKDPGEKPQQLIGWRRGIGCECEKTDMILCVY